MPILEYSLPGSAETYTATVDAPKTTASTGIIIGHGAGGNSSSGHLPKIARAFSDAGILCIRFDCKPPNLAKRVAHAEACLMSAKEKFSVDRWIAAGHSMGGRVASAVAHAHPDTVKAAIFFSYPLHPPGKLEQLRDSPLVDLQQPVLFISGTRDSFCETQQFEAILKRMTSSRVEVHSVEGGDHGLKVKGGKAAVEAVVGEAVDVAMSFAQSTLHGPAGTAAPPHSGTESSAAQPAGQQPAKRKRGTEVDAEKKIAAGGKRQKAKASQRKRKGT